MHEPPSMTLPILLVALAAAAATLIAVGRVVGERELRSLVQLAPRALERPLRVIIPARNESARITPTLEALLASDASRQLEVVVYDDRSSDDTRAVVERVADPRLHVVAGREDPAPGAHGKPAALARALEESDGSLGRHDGLVLFLDADVVLAKGALGALVDGIERSGADALSGVPRFVTVTVVEQLFVPVLASLVGMRYPPTKVHEGKRAFLNGQLILIERRALDDVGGFAGVQDAILEDVALARRLHEAGKRIRLADVTALARTRMYTSWREIAEGFGKNAVAIFDGPFHTVVAALLALALSLSPWLGVALALAARESVVVVVVAASALLVATASQASLRRRLELPLWPVLLLPVAYAGAAVILVGAALRVVTRGHVTWRGRRYRAKAR